MFDGQFRSQAEVQLRPVGTNLKTHRHQGRPPHRPRRASWPWSRRSPSANGALRAGLLLPGAVRRARRARRRRGQGLGHGLAPGRLLRLGRPTGWPTPCSSAAWPGSCRPPGPVASPCCPSPCWALRCSSATSGPRPSRSATTPGAGSWSGPSGSSPSGFGPAVRPLLVAILWVMLVLTAVTAVQRFVKVWRQASARADRRRDRAAAGAPPGPPRRTPPAPGRTSVPARAARGRVPARGASRSARDLPRPSTRRPELRAGALAGPGPARVPGAGRWPACSGSRRRGDARRDA